MSSTTCVSCSQPLILTLQSTPPISSIDQNASGPSTSKPSTYTANTSTSTIPDDVHLPCACHYHWTCLLDAQPYDLNLCPNCSTPLTKPSSSDANREVLPVTLTNEGGTQYDLDILPLLIEENYLKTYPEERKARAFLEWVREGDLESLLEVVMGERGKRGHGDERDSEDRDEEIEDIDIDIDVDVDVDGVDDEDEGEDDDNESDAEDITQQSLDQILRYQDTLAQSRTALHEAVAGQRSQIIWLLLLLASNVEEDRFPDDVKEAAQQLQLTRSNQHGLQDIRTVKDGEGKTAFDLASEFGLDFFDLKILAPP